MKDNKIEEELKKRSHPTFQLKKDPVTGSETWEEDKTATSFSYDSVELEKWIKEGVIPKDLADAHLEELERNHKRLLAVKEMAEKAKLEGRELTLNDWQALTPQNNVTFESIQKSVSFHTFLMENKEKLLKVLQPSTPKKRKYRQAGHFVDQKLKVSQMDIFDSLGNETKDKIEERGIEIRTEGIKLTPPQDKLLNALMKLLHEKSENRDEKSEQFYAGNCEVALVNYGGRGLKGRSATLRIYPSELYKAYLDNEQYSGHEIKFIKSVLQDTEQQKFLIIYEKKYEIIGAKGKREKRTDRIEEFQSLFKIISFFEGLTDEEAKKLDDGNEEVRERRGELIIGFNPLLTDQINSKYVEYPEDINRRTMIAAGGYKLVTESVNALRDYLLREISNKRKTAEINEDNLTHILKLDAYLKASRKSRIKARMQSAIQAAKNLGLITHFERVQGALGQWKYIFHLNPDFYD